MASHSIKIDLKALMKPYGEKLSAVVLPVIAFDVMISDGNHRQGVTVVIYNKHTQRPIASGTAFKAPTDDNHPEDAMKIAAKRACADLSRQSFGILPEREIYHVFRAQRREVTK